MRESPHLFSLFFLISNFYFLNLAAGLGRLLLALLLAALHRYRERNAGRALAPLASAPVDIDTLPGDPPSRDPILQELTTLEFGTWFVFRADQPARSQYRAKLAWYNARTLHFMFVNRLGQQTAVRLGPDLAVDIRAGSPSFGRWVGLTLSAAAWNQLFVPVGFAHGFVTLEPDTEVLYKTSAAYAPASDRAIRYDDPAIGIAWPLPAEALTLSDKDARAPLLAAQVTGFTA